MDELIAQFAIEGRELVQQASDDLLSLEGAPHDRERLESAFRAVHTLKGSVGLFDFGPMLSVLHRAEDLLSQARAGSIAVDAQLIDSLLAVIDWVDDCIGGISDAGELSDVHAKQAGRLLSLLGKDITLLETDEVTATQATTPDWALSALHRAALPEFPRATVAIRYEPHPDCYFSGDDPLATVSTISGLLYIAVSTKGDSLPAQGYDPFRCNLIIEAISSGSLADVETIFRLIPDQVKVVPIQLDQQAAAEELVPDRTAGHHVNVMRVDASRIDKLVEIAGELVTAKNSLTGLADDARNQGSSSLARRITSVHNEIEQLVGSLYGAVTQARMIPLEQTFRRFPRLVRETARKLGKALDLVIEGETVEADREIVENLFEPLLHLVRNSLDHGIELEVDRIKYAKPGNGRILLRADQRGDRIEIEVADDGQGIDPAFVRQIAIDRGVITQEQAMSLSKSATLQLVFAPGFSTASTVTDLSGRGVGLDAVQSAIHRLGGTLEMRSSVGSGTSFLLRLPVSFSMTQLMVVEVGAERYGIPITEVIETHKVPSKAVQAVRSGHAFVLRGRTIPLLRLADLLALPDPGSSVGDLKVLIMRVGQDRVGLAVDVIAERAETLTRPLAGLLQGIPGIAGTTLLGDGRILLVLDVGELVK